MRCFYHASFCFCLIMGGFLEIFWGFHDDPSPFFFFFYFFFGSLCMAWSWRVPRKSRYELDFLP